MTHNMLHVTHEIVTREMWHMTQDMWWGVNILLKCQLSSSYGLGHTVSWRYFHKGWLSESVSELIIDKGVCRTAPVHRVC